MKIFLSFLQDKTELPHPVPSYRFWTHYIKNGIEEAGMTWVEAPEVDWAAGLIPYENSHELDLWKDFSWSKTLAFIKKNQHKIDVFLSYLYPKQIDTHAINEIRKLGIPCINFFCDHVREYLNVPKEFMSFDLIWVPEFEAIDMYKRAKQKYVNLPMPIWISPEYRFLPSETNEIVSFIGTKDELRNNLLGKVIAKNQPIEISGNGWINENFQNNIQIKSVVGNRFFNQIKFIQQHGITGLYVKYLRKFESSISPIPEKYLSDMVTFKEYIRQTKESAITLGINRVQTYKSTDKYPLTYSRLRDLEAPMLGACYLTEHTKGLEQLYDIGIEIETYKSIDELIFKSAELLNNKKKRADLRKNGQFKALSNHSIPQSMEIINQQIFK
ncbi:glycosyltransferase [Pedobacter aquatilis]|uniref:glycosyltransferase n=1 Tax=Pedobacter aquatilis TaxID=351343 RepID=UPI00292D9C01|nr:glycosyltransferase [Pedobacter aquatilis]